MITISVEQPPESMDAESKEYIARMFTQVAAALLEAETEIEELKVRAANLESNL